VTPDEQRLAQLWEAWTALNSEAAAIARELKEADPRYRAVASRRDQAWRDFHAVKDMLDAKAK